MNKEPQDSYSNVKVVKLAEASTAWDGSPLPDYPRATPVVTICKYIFPPHAVTDSHFHSIINCGVVLRGTLTVVNLDGTERDFHAGEAIIETVGTVHHGENRGDSPVEIIMFYAGDSASPISQRAD